MQHSPYDGPRQPASRMHIQEVSSSSSVSERDLTDLVSPPAGLRYPVPAARAYSAQLQSPQYPSHPQPYYSQSQYDATHHHSQPSPALSSGSAPTVLQSFPSWDPTWRSGGVSEDGRAFTNHVPATHTPHWTPQLPQYGPDYGYEEEEHGESQPAQGNAYLGGWEAEYSEEDQHRLTREEYRLGIGFDTSSDPNKAGKSNNKVISEERKAQRMLALEKEFGPASSQPHKGGKEGKLAEVEKGKMSFKDMRNKEKEERARINAELGVGKDGRLITQGPKLRATVRWLQGILALVAIGGGIGGAFLTHPDPDPAPAGKIPTWVLYGVSVVSFLVTFWTFAIRRCFRRSSSESSSQPPASSGIVLPIFQQHAYGQIPGSGGGKQKSGGWFSPGPKKQKGRGGPEGMGQPMTVNLVVDPSMLAKLSGSAPARYDDSGYEEEEQGIGSKRSRHSGGADEREGGDDDDRASDTAYDPDGEDNDFAIPDSSTKQRRRPGLMSVLDPMAAMRLQDRWKAARKLARRQAVQDTVMTLLWLGLSVWVVGFGERCPPGSSNGWCDLYNTALACGVLLCVSFCTSLTLGILDLRRSRSVPRISRGY